MKSLSLSSSIRVHPRGRGPSRSGFTLAEILVVLVIISIIATFAMPAMNSVLRGSKMTIAGDELARDLNLARQVAIKDSAPVEFRFYEIDDPEQPGAEKAFRSYQAVRKHYDPRSPDEFEVEAVTEIRDLPDAVIFSDSSEFSTLLAAPELIRSNVMTGNGEAGRMEGADYRSFIFKTDGSINLPIKPSVGDDNWFVTIIRETDDQNRPREFVTVQVDTTTGHIRRYDK